MFNKKSGLTLFVFTHLLFSGFLYTKNLPIVLVHGILSDKYAMIPAEENIKKYLPDVYVKSVNLGDGQLTSICNMQDQVNWLKKEMESDPHLQDGCIIIAHSQGGLVARYFIEKYNNPHVYVYIAWGTPESGIFGAPDMIDKYFLWLWLLEKHSHKFIYSYPMQRWVSFAGYWKDPLHNEYYLNKCTFLPYINNEIDHADCTLFKKNITDLCTMVLVQSTLEEVVRPAASCHFSFYKPGSYNELESLFDSQWYQEDRLGIKTLAETGRLHLKFAYCLHTDFQKNEYNFLENTLPYLSPDIPTA